MVASEVNDVQIVIFGGMNIKKETTQASFLFSTSLDRYRQKSELKPLIGPNMKPSFLYEQDFFQS